MLCGGSGPRIVLLKMGSHVPRSRKRAGYRIAILCLCLTFVLATPARPQGSVGTFTTFDVPGAGTGVLQGTGGVSINAAGDIAGIYIVAPNVAHGFVRAADGTITTFDAPNAGTGMNQGTFPISINTAGVIVGMYSNASNVYHGFVRAANGTITTVDAPGAATAGHNGTNVMGINMAGAIAGFYRDASAVYHGFMRAGDGTMTYPIDAPGAGTGTYAGTEPLSINSVGDITGIYVVSYILHAAVYHGFVRTADGTITTFDPPGAGTGTGHYGGTFPISINTAGVIAGTYTDASGGHGFVRAANGTITTFDAPGAGTGTGVIEGTVGFSINDAGDITGTYIDASGVAHGFVRAANGTMTPFDAPGAGTAGTSLFPGTAAVSINDLGDITGTYADASGVLHGFVLKLAIAPEAQVANLQNIVEALTSAGTLSPGLGQFLLAPLNAALADLDPAPASAVRAALDRGHTAAAIRELNEFIGRVRLLVIFRRLKPAEGRILIDAANSIITALRV